MKNRLVGNRILYPLATRFYHQETGSLLIIVIWLLVILSMTTIGLSRRMNVDLALTKYAVNKLKSRYVARAGFQYALAKIMIDSQDSTTNAYDTLWQCGVKLDKDQTAADVFRNVPVPGGYFSVGYLTRAGGTKTEEHWGLSDEERKINLNALTSQNYLIFKNLLVILGVENTLAETIAASAVDWKDDKDVTHSPFEAEGAPYQKALSPYLNKNRAFDNVEELLLIQGMNQEIFDRVKDFVTVFPKGSARLAINFNTATREVLQALGRGVAGPLTNTTAEDADSLVRKVVDYRQGDDGKEGTGDDRFLAVENMGLNNKERVVFLTMTQFMTRAAQFFRIRVTGTEPKSGVRSTLDAVVGRGDLAVLSWKMDTDMDDEGPSPDAEGKSGTVSNRSGLSPAF